MKIYSKTGDKGLTSLVGGERVSKCCERLESYGTVDELNAHIGMLISLMEEDTTEEGTLCREQGVFLSWVQSALFVTGGWLATDTTRREAREGTLVTEEMVASVEREIDHLQEGLAPLRSFIMPGGCRAACQAHVCRTVCRRAERCILRLAETGVTMDSLVLSYINRLSDYFFVLARALNEQAGVQDVAWKPREQ